jgi:hypothetical protein
MRAVSSKLSEWLILKERSARAFRRAFAMALALRKSRIVIASAGANALCRQGLALLTRSLSQRGAVHVDTFAKPFSGASGRPYQPVDRVSAAERGVNGEDRSTAGA